MILRMFFLPNLCIINNAKEENIMWTKPEAIEMRYGFEVTMYIANR